MYNSLLNTSKKAPTGMMPTIEYQFASQVSCQALQRELAFVSTQGGKALI
jgi:hypothetical protein